MKRKHLKQDRLDIRKRTTLNQKHLIQDESDKGRSRKEINYENENLTKKNKNTYEKVQSEKGQLWKGRF